MPFLYIIICRKSEIRSILRRALINRRYPGRIPVRLSLLARIVPLAKRRKNVEQKWHCVQPLDHWDTGTCTSEIRRINTPLRMYQRGMFCLCAPWKHPCRANSSISTASPRSGKRRTRRPGLGVLSWAHYALSRRMSQLSLIFTLLSALCLLTKERYSQSEHLIHEKMRELCLVISLIWFLWRSYFHGNSIW